MILLIGVLLTQGLAWAKEHEEGDKGYPNAFFSGNIEVLPEQTIGNLIVAKGNAIIKGQVKRGILVVDGNLVLKTGSSVKGRVMVFDGQAIRETGVYTEKPVWNVLQPNPRITKLLPWIVLFAGIVAVFFLSFVIWILAHWFKDSIIYPKIVQRVLTLHHQQPTIYILAGFGISALMMTLFFEVTEDTIFSHDMDFIDSIVVWLVRYFASPGLDPVMITITDIGSAYFYGLLVPVILLVLAYHRRWLEMLSLTICLAGAAGLNYLIKNLFERARPDLFRVVEESGYGFPSGHAMVALCFYGMIVYLASRSIPSWRWRIVLFLVAGIFVAAIGISRIYLGLHYPSDVLGAYVAGATWLAFCISFIKLWEYRRKHFDLSLASRPLSGG